MVGVSVESLVNFKHFFVLDLWIFVLLFFLVNLHSMDAGGEFEDDCLEEDKKL